MASRSLMLALVLVAAHGLCSMAMSVPSGDAEIVQQLEREPDASPDRVFELLSALDKEHSIGHVQVQLYTELRSHNVKKCMEVVPMYKTVCDYTELASLKNYCEKSVADYTKFCSEHKNEVFANFLSYYAFRYFQVLSRVEQAERTVGRTSNLEEGIARLCAQLSAYNREYVAKSFRDLLTVHDSFSHLNLSRDDLASYIASRTGKDVAALLRFAEKGVVKCAD